MITLKSCPNCTSYSIAHYQNVTAGSLAVEILPGVKIDTTVITRYSICQECHLIFQNPRLSDQELNIFYSSGYYRRTIKPPPEGMDKGEENRAELDAEIIKKNIGKVKSHLDIGCGLGYLLNAVNADIKIGVELDFNYVKLKEIKVYREIEQVSPRKFDLVTLIHTLEHVSHPLDFLKRAAKFVSKSGFLVIEVPSSKTSGGPFGFPHLSYFEPDVLKLMCVQARLRVIDVEFTPHLVLICRVSNN
jgi:SAM-dependent methyltransferase